MQDSLLTSELIGMAFKEFCLNIKPLSSQRFSSSRERIHTIMYNLAEKYAPALSPLQRLHFATAGAFPYSTGLDAALGDLIASGILISFKGSNGDTYLKCSIHPDSRQFLARWSTEVFTDDPDGLQSFQNFARELGDTLYLLD